ncbi:hypothetical protein HHK36_018644 [Tetracentron sinense]|uniref:Protein TIC110, chloroplastic n=1 Tax=Tetracentron sinense TaxID=13715 RepID=A0A835DBG6_TETSI|nr:hypothetical protein HHK36_018644 [Tetracentron sinense]
MNLYLLIPTPSPSPSHPVFFSQFINPNPLCIRNPRNSLARTHRYRISIVRSSAADAEEPSTSLNFPVFGEKKELSGMQSLADGLSPSVRLASSVVIVAGALAAGYGLGYRFGGTRNTALGAAVALGAAGGAAVYALNSCVPEVAAVNLHNFVASCNDPGALKKEDIEGIAEKYGVSKQDEAFNAELCDMYSRYLRNSACGFLVTIFFFSFFRFVSSVLPPGSENLKGNEIGRRIFRQRLETGDRDADIEQRRVGLIIISESPVQAFQKLIYVSTLVFGEASTFLLPWKRVFKVTDAQIGVAIRDNAQRLYAFKLESIGRDVNEEQLVSLREAQLLYRLSDELAADMFKECTRKLVEENISTALDILKSRTRAVGATRVVEELENILAFNNFLISLRNHPDIDHFARGVGPVSLLGGEYDDDRKIDDLKLLYRVYVAESFSSGRMEEYKLVGLNHLKNIFGLGKREAEAIMLDVTSKVYRKRLSQAVSSGDLEAANSKAAFLQNICDELHFNPQKASEIHEVELSKQYKVPVNSYEFEEIYRQKLQQSVADGELSEENVAILLRLRVMLCIPQQIVEAVHADICGSLFEKSQQAKVERQRTQWLCSGLLVLDVRNGELEDIVWQCGAVDHIVGRTPCSHDLERSCSADLDCIGSLDWHDSGSGGDDWSCIEGLSRRPKLWGTTVRTTTVSVEMAMRVVACSVSCTGGKHYWFTAGFLPFELVEKGQGDNTKGPGLVSAWEPDQIHPVRGNSDPRGELLGSRPKLRGDEARFNSGKVIPELGGRQYSEEGYKFLTPLPRGRARDGEGSSILPHIIDFSSPSRNLEGRYWDDMLARGRLRMEKGPETEPEFQLEAGLEGVKSSATKALELSLNPMEECEPATLGVDQGISNIEASLDLSQMGLEADSRGEEVVKDAIAAGVDGYDADVRASVRKAAYGLRLTREAAMAIASKAVRKMFMNYIKRSRAAGNRTEAAKELKKMIAFNTLVVTELVADIKGESSDTAMSQELVKEELKQIEDEERESLQTLRKTRPDKELVAKLGKPGQTEITLKDDLPERDRTDLYKTYLLFCLTGEVTNIPFGAQITTKKDNSEYLLLNQLGGILGLTGKEIVEVHRGLAEQAFRQQAEVILADGQLTKARIEQLNEVQKQVGLPAEHAQKVIKSITTTKMSAAIETAISQGRLSIKQIRELKEASVDLDSMISESLRENLFKKTVDEIFSSGTGDFDEEEVYERIPSDLSINAEKATGVVRELAKSRLSNSLIQAVALLRQRNHAGVVSSLNDLLACDKAVPAGPLSWEVPEEVADLFSIYLKSDPVPEKLSRLQYLLGISDSTAAALREMGERGLPIGTEEEEFAF